MGLLDKIGGAIDKGLSKVGSAIDKGVRSVGDKIVETKVGQVVADVAKTAVVAPNASYKSIFGKDIVDTKAYTKVGGLATGAIQVGIDSGHDVLKAYANNITGNYAEKLHVAVVKGYDPDKPNDTVFTGGVLGKTENIIKSAAPVIGNLAANVVKSKSAEKQAAPGTQELQKSAVQSSTGSMSFISDAGKFLQTDIGKSVQGVLGGVVNNLLTPKPKAPSPVPQQLVFSQPTVPNVAEKMGTAVQQAVFGNAGNTPPPQKEGWWSMNKMWALPVAIVVGVFFVVTLVFSLFKRRR